MLLPSSGTRYCRVLLLKQADFFVFGRRYCAREAGPRCVIREGTSLDLPNVRSRTRVRGGAVHVRYPPLQLSFVRPRREHDETPSDAVSGMPPTPYSPIN